MGVRLDHTIVWCRDKQKSATFLTEILGLPHAIPSGPFLVVELENAVSIDYYEREGTIALQHYAFRVSENEFDVVFARLRERGLEYWADPGKDRPGEIYHHDGGRGVYFDDPDGHLLEILSGQA